MLTLSATVTMWSARRPTVPRNSQAEFSAWLRSHEIALTKAARAIAFDIQNAPDILQEALADVYQRWRKLKDHENLEAYTIRVMVSKHADFRRKYGRKQAENEIPLELVASLLQLADQSEDIAERLIVQAAIASLTSAQRAVLLMYYDYGYSLKEISQNLEIPTGTAASHLARGRSAISEYVQFSPKDDSRFSINAADRAAIIEAGEEDKNE